MNEVKEREYDICYKFGIYRVIMIVYTVLIMINVISINKKIKKKL